MIAALATFAKEVARGGEEGPLRTAAYRTGLGQQLTATSRTTTLLYAVTTTVALILLSGGVPDGMSVSLFGTELPLSILSIQALSVVNATLFAKFVMSWMNYLMLVWMLGVISYDDERGEGYQFYSADISSEILWGAVFRVSDAGLVVRPRKILPSIVMGVSFTTLVAHALIVLAASILALNASLGTIGFATFLGVLGVAIVAVSIVTFLAVVALPQQYEVEG